MNAPMLAGLALLLVGLMLGMSHDFRVFLAGVGVCLAGALVFTVGALSISVPA